jgi:threonine dehydrogenase-like Zn-dependent dehydrogenase
VTGFREGDRVLSHGHHAAWVCAPAASATVLPEAVSDEMAAFGVLGQTTLNGVRLAHLALGETVVIVGLGLLGQLASQYARLSGAFPLLAVDLADGRLALAARLGADHTLNPARTDVVQAVHNLTDGRLAEVVFEVTGSPGVVPLTLKLAARLGRVILLDSSRGPTTVDFHDDVHTRGLRLIGAHTTTAPAYETPYHPWTPARNTALFLQLVMAGRLQIEPLISHRVPWSQAPAVFQMLSEDRTQAMGVILQWDEGNEDQHCHG